MPLAYALKEICDATWASDPPRAIGAAAALADLARATPDPEIDAVAAVAGSLAIGASTPADTRAGFSTYGAWVRLAAPGEAIVSTVPGGGYGTWSGTSMAAPLTAGAAALVRATYPTLKAHQVTERLVSTGHGISGPIARRLDVAAALGLPAASSTGCPGGCRVFLPLTNR